VAVAPQAIRSQASYSHQHNVYFFRWFFCHDVLG
jgi:hypothetical protein